MQPVQWNTRAWIVGGLSVSLAALVAVTITTPKTTEESRTNEPTTVAGPVGPYPAGTKVTEETEKTESEAPSPVTPLSPLSPPTSVKLTVPFAEQAPKRVWDADHEDFCEEASALMVGRYFQGRSVGSADDVDAALFELKRWEEEHLSTWVSTSAAETARMIREVYGLNVDVVDLTTASTSQESPPAGGATSEENAVSTLKQALADGKLVVVPAAGQQLGNPHFTPPGPRYHMLVVIGYTADGRFITNDPGVWQGEDWTYSAEVLINAIGDWNNGDPEHGAKVVLVVSRS